MEEKYEGLVLKTMDYKDNDKLVTVLAAEKGKMLAVCKGAKKANAKLRFAAQPFCFAEFVFAQKAGRYTLTSAYLHDGFYSLREDVAKFYAASVVTQVCDKILPDDMPADELLLSAVKAIGLIAESDVGEEGVPLLTFLLDALSLSGYGVTADKCACCGGEISSSPFFDFALGAFCCKNCETDTRVSPVTYQTIRFAMGDAAMEKPTSDGVKRALRLLKEYFLQKTELPLECLSEYIRLL